MEHPKVGKKSKTVGATALSRIEKILEASLPAPTPIPEADSLQNFVGVGAIVEDANLEPEPAGNSSGLQSALSLPRKKSKKKQKGKVTGIRGGSIKGLAAKPKKSRKFSVVRPEGTDLLGFLSGMAATRAHSSTNQEKNPSELIIGHGQASSSTATPQRASQDEITSAGIGAEESAASSTPATNGNKVVAHKTPLPIPLAKNPNQLDVNIYLGRVNTYINSLGYHHVGEPGIRVLTHLSLRHHMDTARQIIKAGENIKCLHALLLGIYFTNCTTIIERFPINFKSKFNGKEYRHVVLGIYLYGAYGALGISRDPGLQDKPPKYTRLSELLIDYIQCYTQSGHVLMEIKVGGVIPHDPSAQCGIPWRVGVINLAKFANMQQFATEADKLARLVKVQMGQTCIRQIRPPEMTLPVSLLENPEKLMKMPGTTATLIAESEKLAAELRATVAAASTKSSLQSTSIASAYAPSTKSRFSTKNLKPKRKKVLKHKRFIEP